MSTRRPGSPDPVSSTTPVLQHAVSRAGPPTPAACGFQPALFPPPSPPVAEGPPGLTGSGAIMRRLYAKIRKVASLEIPVLILGESGTGKERVARAIHLQGPRMAAPFVPVHCAAIPESLLEAELFGHVRGAFTGADRERSGLVEAAQGGTLFLDEIGELPPSTQVKLLRLLQEREVRRLGESRLRRVDVRIVTATHRDLRREVAAGRFREDLFYRLHVVTVRVPPLRERGEDVLSLATDVLDRAAREEGLPRCFLGEAARRRLLAHPWPGNVRELENCLRAALVEAGPEQVLEAEDLHLPESPQPAIGLREILRKVEVEAILLALQAEGGNRSAAARRLGISRQSLHEKLRRLGIGEEDRPARREKTGEGERAARALASRGDAP